MNGIKSQKISHMDVGNFWKDNEPILEMLERKRMPSNSRMVYKDASSSVDKSDGRHRIQYDLVNFYDNRKQFLKILAKFGPDMSLGEEVILSGPSLSEAKKTVLDGSRVTSQGHVRWLRQIAERLVAGDVLR